MTVMSNDRAGTGVCVSDIEAVDVIPLGANSDTSQGYNIETRIAFIGPNSDISPCFDNRELGNPITAASDELNIIVDIYIISIAINNIIV